MGDDDRYGHNHHGGGHRVPDGETDYLAKAAEQLDRAAKNNERLGDLFERRERIARGYALLGAIQRGVLPQEMAKVLYENITEAGR